MYDDAEVQEANCSVDRNKDLLWDGRRVRSLFVRSMAQINLKANEDLQVDSCLMPEMLRLFLYASFSLSTGSLMNYVCACARVKERDKQLSNIF